MPSAKDDRDAPARQPATVIERPGASSGTALRGAEEFSVDEETQVFRGGNTPASAAIQAVVQAREAAQAERAGGRAAGRRGEGLAADGDRDGGGGDFLLGGGATPLLRVDSPAISARVQRRHHLTRPQAATMGQISA